jgi:hypothetical protein
MYWSIPASKDATIYEGDPYRNTGLDEILEIKAGNDPNTGEFVEARSLIKFDDVVDTLDYITGTFKVAAGDIGSYLVLHTVQKSELPETYVIEALQIGDDWLNGSGYTTSPVGTVTDTYASDGVTWQTIGGKGSTTWVAAAADSGAQTSYTSFPGGGDYSTSITGSTEFSFKKNDNVVIDVSKIIKNWYGSGDLNAGFLLKFNTIVNSKSFQQGMPTVQLYSSETHTVYEPQLIFAWNDQAYSISTSTVATSTDSTVIYPIVFKNSYPQGTAVKVLLGARPRYPRRTFSQNTDFATLIALPQTTFYQIRDAHSNEVIMPYSQYTEVSSDDSSSILQMYFSFYTGLLYPERFYQIEFKIQYDDGTEDYIVSEDFIFKVTYNDTFNGNNIIA